MQRAHVPQRSATGASTATAGRKDLAEEEGRAGVLRQQQRVLAAPASPALRASSTSISGAESVATR